MKLTDITVNENRGKLCEARRPPQIGIPIIRALGAHIVQIKQGNQILNRKMNLLGELIRIMAAGSIDDEVIKQALLKAAKKSAGGTKRRKGG